MTGLIAKVLLLLFFICNTGWNFAETKVELPFHVLVGHAFSHTHCNFHSDSVTGLRFLILFFTYYGWNIAENKAKWPPCISVIDSWDTCLVTRLNFRMCVVPFFPLSNGVNSKK